MGDARAMVGAAPPVVAARIRDVQLELLDDLGYRAIWEAPEEMAELIGDFLAFASQPCERAT